MDKAGKKHAPSMVSTIVFLMLLFSTQTSTAIKFKFPKTPKTPSTPSPPQSTIKEYLICVRNCATGCLPLATPELKVVCVGKCFRKCLLGPNGLLEIDDSCKPTAACVGQMCSYHVTEADDLQEKDIDNYVKCVGVCDNQIGECDNFNQPRDLAPVASPSS